MIVSSSQRIGVVTSRPEKLPDYFPTTTEPDFIPTEPPFTPDDQLLVDELRRRGHQVSAIVWGADTSRLTERFDRVIIRSPWDYMDSDELRRGFLHWLEDLAATGFSVENEPQVMLWLMDKRYLLDFAAVGVPIVPTQLIPAGGSFDLETFVERHVGAVIKPAVGCRRAVGIPAGSRDGAGISARVHRALPARGSIGAALSPRDSDEWRMVARVSRRRLQSRRSQASRPRPDHSACRTRRLAALRRSARGRKANGRPSGCGCSTGLRESRGAQLPDAALPANRHHRDRRWCTPFRVRRSRAGALLPRPPRERRPICGVD